MGLTIDRAIASTDRGALVVWLAVLGGLYVLLAVSYLLAFRLEIMASLPVDDVLHLLPGNRGIDDVERTTADCLVRTDVGALMLDVLFPISAVVDLGVLLTEPNLAVARLSCDPVSSGRHQWARGGGSGRRVLRRVRGAAVGRRRRRCHVTDAPRSRIHRRHDRPLTGSTTDGYQQDRTVW